jgi:hypothetical protein
MSCDYLKGLTVTDLLARIGASKERKKLDITITPAAAETLKRLMQRPNPRLAEFAFLGLGLNDPQVIDRIVACEGDYSANSGLMQDGQLRIVVNQQELQSLFDQIYQEGLLNKLTLIGHYQPSGTCVVEGVRYVIRPDYSMLEPSAGRSGSLAESGDIQFYKAFIELNPQFSCVHVGIAAHTPQGPKLKMYRIGDLIKLRRYREFEKTAQTITNL